MREIFLLEFFGNPKQNLEVKKFLNNFKGKVLTYKLKFQKEKADIEVLGFLNKEIEIK